MKQTFIHLLFLAIFSQSCVSLFGPRPSHLVGTWVLESIDGQVSPQDEQMIGVLILEFRENGTMKTDLPGTMEYIEGTYEINKKTLLMTQDENPATATILSLRRDKLWIQPVVVENEEPYQLRFVRK